MSRSLLIAVLSVALLAGCDRAGTDAAQPTGAMQDTPSAGVLTGQIDTAFAGTLRPDMMLSDPAGATLDLGEVDGPVLINLWATWCAPCVVEMPQLDALAGELDGEVQVITVSQDLRGGEVVEPFFAQKGFAWLEPWLDPETQLSAQFSQSGQLPLTILFDAAGKEVWRVAGGYEWDSPGAIAAVRQGVGAR